MKNQTDYSDSNRWRCSSEDGLSERIKRLIWKIVTMPTIPATIGKIQSIWVTDLGSINQVNLMEESLNPDDHSKRSTTWCPKTMNGVMPLKLSWIEWIDSIDSFESYSINATVSGNKERCNDPFANLQPSCKWRTEEFNWYNSVPFEYFTERTDKLFPLIPDAEINELPGVDQYPDCSDGCCTLTIDDELL